MKKGLRSKAEGAKQEACHTNGWLKLRYLIEITAQAKPVISDIPYKSCFLKPEGACHELRSCKAFDMLDISPI